MNWKCDCGMMWSQWDYECPRCGSTKEGAKWKGKVINEFLENKNQMDNFMSQNVPNMCPPKITHLLSQEKKDEL